MNVQELMNLFQDNIYKLNNKEFFKQVLSLCGGLSCFDVINKVLILLQSKNVTDLRAENDWAICGKRLNTKVKPIYILCPKFKAGYVDKITNLQVNSIDLNQPELNNAVELGLIEKTDDIAEMATIPIYNISDTRDNDEYTLAKPDLSILGLFNAIRDITGYRIEKASSEKDEGILNDLGIIQLCGDKYNEIASSISRVMPEFFVDNMDNAEDWKLDLIKNSLVYEFSIILNQDCSKVDFDMLDNIEGEQAFDILNKVNSFMQMFIGHLKYSDTGYKPMTIKEIDKIRRADIMLDSLRAFSIRQKLK